MPTSRGPLRPSGAGSVELTRHDPAPPMAGLIRHYWISTWDIPADTEHEQRILAYPACNLVVEIGGTTPDPHGRLFGPVTGLSRRRLAGKGSAFGVLLQPAVGALISDVPLAELADSSRAAESFGFTVGPDIASALATQKPVTPQQADGGPVPRPQYLEVFENWLAARLPEGVDEEGLLINRVADEAENDGGLLQVRMLASRFGLGERSLQRLVRDRLGLTPKWLIQRRRLQEAAHLLAQGSGPDLARLAYALGYADQAHFSRDFSAVTGMTPTRYLRQPGTAPTTR
ncbi:AraC family transcriptional regulator [Arthrobacter sp.]|uniref:AraC family transcriptional regulator n=1 Tax=Arthrobacter sp. TaxID=1667 RepID=UPI003A8CDF5F